MAKPHSTRHEARSSIRRQSGRTPSRRTQAQQLAADLQKVALALKVVYSACAVTEMALRAQSADRDQDIFVTLRHHVSEPVGREAEKLTQLAARL